LFGSPGPLNGDGEEDEIDGGPAAGNDLQHIADGRTSGASDEGDASRKAREGAFAGGIEESFTGQFFAKLSEGEFERSESLGPDFANDDLVGTAGFVDLDASGDDDLESVLKLKFEALGGIAPEDGSDLGGVVLEGQVDVSGSGTGAVGDFAAHADGGEGDFQNFLDVIGQFADAEDREFRPG